MSKKALAITIGILCVLAIIIVASLSTPYQEPKMQRAIQNADMISADIYKVHIELPNAGGFTTINTFKRYTDDAILQIERMPNINILHIAYDYSGDRYWRADVYFTKG